MIELSSIPALLRAIRAQLGLSQEQLAGRMEVATSTVFRWEAGSCQPQPAKVKVIVDIACEAGLNAAQAHYSCCGQ